MDNDLVVAGMQQVTLYEAVVWVVFVCAALYGVFNFGRLVYKLISNINKQKDNYADQSDIVKQHTETLQALQESDQTIYASLQELNAKIDVLAGAVEMMQKKQDAQDIARIKATISERYTIYHKRGQISTIEKTVLEDLIHSLELANEHNTFVHDIVQPELYTWDVVDNE